jgi:Fem-1 family protein b
MIAAFKGHLDVVKCLLEKGADPNQKAHCGATALHFSSECGHVAIVEELLNNGAEVTRNDQGMSPLLCAAERTKADVVEFLLSRPEFSKEERIEALELLGASFANDKDSYNLDLAYNYLHRAMKVYFLTTFSYEVLYIFLCSLLFLQSRFEDPEHILVKPISVPIEAYENWIETRNLSELESIQFDSNAVHMESLVIRERILGINNPEVAYQIV